MIPIESQNGQWFLTQAKDMEQGKALGLYLTPNKAGLILLASGDRLNWPGISYFRYDGEDGSIQGL